MLPETDPRLPPARKRRAILVRMALYYFDIHDGEHDTRDEEGSEFAELDAVRREAIRILPDIAREVMPNDGDRRDVIVDVRNGTGMVIYTATLSLIGRWME